MTDTVLVDVADRVATITINRPEARNSLDLATLEALMASVASMEADDAVDVAILTGTDPTFCAGLDLRSLSSGEIDVAEHTVRGNTWKVRSKPLLCAANGPAITGGLEIVLMCDIVIASERASFADTHTRVGILPWWGMSVALPRAVGRRNAALMSMTGNFVSAEQAAAWGLVSEVTAHDDLLDRTRELATDIVGNDQPGVRAMLGLYRDGAGLTTPEAAALEHERAIAWQSEGFDASEIGRRFEAIKARGRAQRSGSG